jgi:site-specific DNA recombinase
MKRAAIYARFSTDRQNERSIDDQIALCREIAKREGLRVVRIFKDYAKSGATLDRDGVRELREAMLASEYEVLICESLTRLSRDEEDLHGLWKRLDFNAIDVLTVDGKVTPMHVLMMSWFGKEYLRQLGIHVHRHHSAFAREGKIAGSVPYGYRIVKGKPGEPEIDPEQAKIVRRIFRMYAEGMSPRFIALKLTHEGVPCSMHRREAGDIAWNYQTLIGGGVARTGMLSNHLYIGELVWNQTRSMINPDTLKKNKRKTKEKPIITQVPHLRIVDQALWDAAQAQRDGRRRGKRPGTIIPRRDHLLAGILRCGVCNGMMRMVNSRQFACAAADAKGTCIHRKSYNGRLLVQGLSARLAQYTADPKLIEEAVGELKAKFRVAAKNVKSESLDEARKRLNRAQLAIDRVVGLVLRAVITEQEAGAELVKLRQEKATYEERVRLIEAEKNVVALHPTGMKAFQTALKKLNEVLRNPGDPRFKYLFRNLVDTIVIHPTPPRAAYEVSPFVRWGALVSGISLEPKTYTAAQVLKEEGISAKSIKAGESSLTCLNRSSGIVPLGRWQLAA